jgi:hypothetical protein
MDPSASNWTPFFRCSGRLTLGLPCAEVIPCRTQQMAVTAHCVAHLNFGLGHDLLARQHHGPLYAVPSSRTFLIRLTSWHFCTTLRDGSHIALAKEKRRL